MGTPKSGLWIAAALVASAFAACLWLFFAQADDDGAPVAAPSADVAVSAAPRRPATSQPTRADEGAAVVEIDDAPPADDATFVVRGSVVDASGAPIEGARVEVSTWRQGPDFYGDNSRGAKTAADGSYIVEGLEADAVWSAQASAAGFASSPRASAVVATSKRLETRRDFVLARLGGLDVVVLDDGGAPIAHRTWIRPTDADRGNFDVSPHDLEPGRYRVFVAAPGRAGEVRDVDVADGATTRVEFRLGPAVAISGMLLAPDGEPLSGYALVAFASDATPPYSDHRTKTGRDGSFTFGGLRRTRYDVNLDAVGAELLEFTADGGERLEAPADAVRLTARSTATVRFRLVYPPGFTAAQKAADVGVAEVVRSRHQRVAARWDYDRGAVKVPGGEDVEIVIDAPDCLQFRRRVCVQPGAEFDSGDVALLPALEISGRVVDATGAGVPRTNVVGRFDGDSSTVGGDWDGSFRLVRLPPGEIVVVASCAGFADSAVRCTSGQTEPVVVTLRRGGRLHVRATRADGSPLGDAAVRLAATDGVAPTGGVLDAFGEFASRVAVGRWRVEVAGCPPVDVEIREGATTSVTVRAASR